MRCFKSIVCFSSTKNSSSVRDEGDMTMYEVGKCLLPDLLVQARITQQELADKLGVTKQQINTYTSNKRGDRKKRR